MRSDRLLFAVALAVAACFAPAPAAAAPPLKVGMELAYAWEKWTQDSYVAVRAPSIDIDQNYSFTIGPNALFGDTNPKRPIPRPPAQIRAADRSPAMLPPPAAAG